MYFYLVLWARSDQLYVWLLNNPAEEAVEVERHRGGWFEWKGFTHGHNEDYRALHKHWHIYHTKMFCMTLLFDSATKVFNILMHLGYPRMTVCNTNQQQSTFRMWTLEREFHIMLSEHHIADAESYHQIFNSIKLETEYLRFICFLILLKIIRQNYTKRQ